MSEPTLGDSAPSWLEKIRNLFSNELKDKEQLTNLLRSAHEEEIIDFDSLRMMEGVLQVAQMQVYEVMVPRAEMTILPKEATLEEILPIVSRSGHSRFPVIGENKDEVLGILLAKDLLNSFICPETKFSLKEILRPAVFVPESKRLNVLLHEFRKNRLHMAMVVDEYGGVSGLVTIEDALEQIVGDIEDEHDIDKDLFIRKHKNNYYSVKAITPIEEFNHFFSTALIDSEFDTIGGLVTHAFGYVPKRGESINVNGIPFKVLRANHRRIQLLQTTLVPKKETVNNETSS